ncbi:MAG: serine/threonine protein kinase [Planctomycetes bacterium]|nr:serine/threonine protein kinase [Planctomycetota bacterium]
MAVTLETIIKRIEDSGVVDSDQLRPFVTAAASTSDPGALLRALIRKGVLTKFQAEQIVAGKFKNLLLGNYVLLEKIGEGGMGQVYKAQHRHLKRVVAIKMLPPGLTKDAAATARFQREAEVVAKLNHPNIVIAFDATETNGIPYLVMEYITGSDLSALSKKYGRFAIDNAVDHITQAARGLAYAHSQGVVHRDIKPANLLLDQSGVVKVLDLGLALIEDAEATDKQLTNSEVVMGTVDYMAPEQANNMRHADARSDVYSLGCSLFRVLVGESVYEGNTPIQKILAHLKAPIPSLCAKRPDAPAELDRIFARMVAKRPEDRYQNAGELLVDLERFCMQRAAGNASGADSAAQAESPPPPRVFAAPASPQYVEDGMTAAMGMQQMRSIYQAEVTARFNQAAIQAGATGPAAPSRANEPTVSLPVEVPPRKFSYLPMIAVAAGVALLALVVGLVILFG